MRLARLLLVILAAISIYAQPATEPADAEREKKVDTLFQEWSRTDAPGFSIAVIRDGKTVLAKGYGMADLERDVPITPRTVFDIGSTSKQFTAAAILLLEQEGKLSLGDDIRKYLPEIPAYEKPITIRHLLNHTSGLRDYLTLMGLAGQSFNNDYSDEETLSWVARQKALNFTPGAEHLYSNTGYYLLGQIVERASGLSLRKYASAKIFEPLGMTSTHFHDDPAELVRHRAVGYAPAGEGFQIEMSAYHVVGDGALYTTTEDLARWDANFYKPVVGGTALLDALHRRGVRNDGKELDYAAGLMHATRSGRRTVMHGGAWAGYRAEMVRFPEQKLTVIALANFASANPTALALSVADVYLDAPVTNTPAARPEEKTRVVTAGEMRRIGGLFLDRASGLYRRVTVREGKLWYMRGARPSELRPLANGSFAVAGSPLTVRFVPDSMEVISPSTGTTVFSRVEEWATEPNELHAYAGQYRSEEIAAPHHIKVDDGKLVLRAGYQTKGITLRPAERDVFESDQVTLRFIRDGSGALNAYTIAAGRVKEIRFERVK